ncbi:rod shape-determining protein MreC [Flavobacterium lipolyticum]|uniref:Cell shape-determining protein MreC n=1 Tax=Flavobacterium lipolyticum TaxID=2893754 RepID=A0ABS8M4M6_9FLAO|nr:rod shape-determining protein MreC [Flavobacterium sp. F-126]MCC9019769.1 rod shape-determining protein MreC [Flavobacterium sp. F-126]
MRRIFNFIYTNSNRIVFLLLLGTSLGLTIQSHSYHKSRFISVTNSFSEGVHQKIDEVREYINLVNKNDSLAQENAKLLEMLFYKQKEGNVPEIDSIFGIGSDDIIVSKLIRNSYTLQQNYLIISSGLKDGIKSDMGVINNRGIVGVVDKVSQNFALVTSVLNTKSLINARIKNSNYFGTLSWNGKNAGFVQLIDVPRTTSVKKGDTIVTGGISEIFPENVDIGIVDKTLQENNSFVISVKLFNDMTNLEYMCVLKSMPIKNAKKQ